MTSSEQATDQNVKDLADQSLSSESIANEIQSPSLISHNSSKSNNSSKNNNNGPQILAPNNAEEQQIQLNSDQDQLSEESPPPSQNTFIRHMKSIGNGIYNAMYNAGGFLADLFGITTPRYAYAIHEYEKYQERLRQRQLELENQANGEGLNDVENPTNSPEPDHAL